MYPHLFDNNIKMQFPVWSTVKPPISAQYCPNTSAQIITYFEYGIKYEPKTIQSECYNYSACGSNDAQHRSGSFKKLLANAANVIRRFLGKELA